MNLTTASMDLKDDQARTRKIKLNEFTVRGGILSYKSTTVGYKYNFDCYSILSLFFQSLPHGGVSYIIQLNLDHFDSTLVDHLRPYLSVCPIRHPLWFSVSCGSQGSTIQGSSLHKCGQKSSCSTFNVVVAVFPQIFLSSHHPYMCMMHVLITGVSWKVTLIVGIQI